MPLPLAIGHIHGAPHGGFPSLHPIPERDRRSRLKQNSRLSGFAQEQFEFQSGGQTMSKSGPVLLPFYRSDRLPADIEAGGYPTSLRLSTTGTPSAFRLDNQ